MAKLENVKSDAQLNVSTVRVLHVLSSLSVRNGMLSVMESYRKHLDPEKVVFDYLYFFDLPDNRKDEIEGCGSRTFYLPFQKDRRSIRSIEIFFADHDGEWDILHCHPPFTPQLFANAAKRHGVQRVIAHSHSTVFSDKPLSAARNSFLSKFLGLFATDYMTCSNAARVLLGRHGSEAFLLRNAIECEKFMFDETARISARAEFGIDAQCLLLGSVGRLVEQKNQSYMLDILAELLRKNISCKLVIAGSGDKEQSLLDKANKIGVLNNLILLGNRFDTPRLYAAFDAFLLTSLFEGLPISLIEAQASGLPCFVSEAITPEASIVNTKMLSLESRPSVWAEAILGKRECNLDRVMAYHLVKNAGFDVVIESERLAHYYATLVGAEQKKTYK